MIINMTIIQHKRGTSSNWTLLDPVLSVAEIGYETDTARFKIGDGTSTWSALSYFSATGAGSGTLSSVGLAVPTGLTVSNSPLTADGTITIAYDTGYSIPLDSSQTNWDTAYGWGDHASAGYITTTGNNTFTGTQTLAPSTASETPLIAKGFTAQSANLQEWQNVGGSVLASISSGGAFSTTSNIESSGYGVFGTTASSSYQLLVATTSASRVGLGVRGTISQTGDLQQWQNNLSNVLAKVDASGNITGASFVKTGGASTEFLKADGSVDTNTYLTATTNSAITITNNTSSTNTTTGALKVTGGVGIQENLNVGGNLTVTGDFTILGTGTTTTINSTVVTIDDPIFVLGGDTAPGSDDNKDRGIAFRWHNGSTAKIGFFGFDDSAQQFTFIPDATITSEVISGTAGIIAANLNGVAASANELSTPRYIWGQTFDGTDNVSGSLTDVGDITSSDAIFSIGTTSVSTVTGNRIAVTGGTTSNTIGSGGYISLTGGSATASTGENFGGDVDIAGGASTLSASGTGGSVSILGGNGATKGSISIGTSNTSAITIGASGITTTVAGTLSASLNALTISSPLSGTSYNGSSAVSIGLSTGYGDTQNPYGTKSQYYVLAGPVTPTPGQPTFRALVSGDIPNLSSIYLPLTGGTLSGNVQIQTAGTAALSIGRVDGTSSTPYIDFNSGATAIDYDSRIIASGGTGTSGQGNLAFYAGASTFTGNATVTGDLTVTGGDVTLGAAGTATTIKTLATTGASSGSLTISTGNTTSAGTSGNISIDVGNGATGDGSISIGDTYASAITIGKTGTTTTINGTLSAAISAAGLTGTIPDTVLGNSTVYIGTTAVALNRTSANLALTGITSLTGGTGTTSLLIESADTSGVASGSVLVTSGEATSATAGTVKVDTGSNGVPGSGGANVSIGTTNASSVTIGRSGITTTIQGTLSATVSNATNAASSDTVKTVATASNASFYPTFVDANNGTATSETVYTDAGLVYNPSSNTLTIGGNLVVGGVSIQVEGATDNSFETLLTVTDPTADRTITFPDADGTVALTSGVVTSVTGTSPVNSSGGTTPAISLASGYGDTQNPYGSKTTNYVLAGPAGGPSASPSFRALVAADIPSLSGTYLALGGGTMTGAITLRSGSNTAGTAPLYFSSSTNLLSTAVAGAMEYNNRALYFTPDISQGRALVSTPFYKMISSDTTVQFNVAPGVATTYSAFGTNGISLDTGSSYEVEMLLMLQASAASNSSTLIITPGSPSSAATPSASQFYYDYSDSTTVISSATATSGVLRTGTTTFPSLNTITIATGTTRYVKAFMKGIVRVGTGGNFTIRLAFAPTSPGTVTGNVYAGSYLKITPLGIEGATDIGTWA